MRATDHVSVDMPNVLRDRLARLRLHHRMPLYEVIEEAVEYWEACGGWLPHVAAPVDAN